LLGVGHGDSAHGVVGSSTRGENDGFGERSVGDRDVFTTLDGDGVSRASGGDVLGVGAVSSMSLVDLVTLRSVMSALPDASTVITLPPVEVLLISTTWIFSMLARETVVVTLGLAPAHGQLEGVHAGGAVDGIEAVEGGGGACFGNCSAGNQINQAVNGVIASGAGNDVLIFSEHISLPTARSAVQQRCRRGQGLATHHGLHREGLGQFGEVVVGRSDGEGGFRAVSRDHHCHGIERALAKVVQVGGSGTLIRCSVVARHQSKDDFGGCRNGFIGGHGEGDGAIFVHVSRTFDFEAQRFGCSGDGQGAGVGQAQGILHGVGGHQILGATCSGQGLDSSSFLVGSKL